ncbi:FAD-dependent pyridine nucleotide-disulfide oxidoreductase [Halorubrum californiense DSM 19288]|uniref:FAD-dependent pyridine nucleotide-disulfide oxidoreductase n=1 Tax=Halorubrum californiense DSM 19288 TaxID=1227465 RepID=M0E078_9EURY|nr:MULTISPECIES: FAD-dependent oxidoreductase [Halorubrum]ELZ40352.1 FAD-dependent pyridine nucleotide-disulfide oxidoreductase [Halorubrum californiense DSM 19288]TKX73332.1 pyridine nucleotide-disulfide oxidoreductase [Halorubrum sp. GN11GM_10-3_MGM]
MSDPFVVVGADAAGLSAASKFRREASEREVVVFEKGRWISYAYCGMPYFIAGYVDSMSNLLSLSPSEVDERGIDLQRGSEVVAVDPDAKRVTVETTGGDRFEQEYEDLLVATGARATTGPFDVRDVDGAFTLHNMDAAAAIDAYVAEPDTYDPERADADAVDRERVDRNAAMPAPETAAVVGGGYVGVEVAEALAERGLSVHVFHRSGHLLSPFGETVGNRVEAALEAEGVTVHTDTPVEALVGDDRIEAVEVGGGTDGAPPETVPVDMAVVGVGIRPNTDLLDGTGVDLGPGEAVRVDDRGRTSLPDVYAAGDCATARHAVTGEPDWLPLGLTANRAGRAIGATVAGDPTPVGDIAGTAAVKAFDTEAARVGILDPEAAEEAGFDPVSETVTAGSRSGYYPGAAETDATLVADRDTGRLLGGSIVGTDRAAIRIDTLATAIEADMTVSEVERLDLAYAPPFSPVWDPILVAGKVLNGTIDG